MRSTLPSIGVRAGPKGKSRGRSEIYENVSKFSRVGACALVVELHIDKNRILCQKSLRMPFEMVSDSNFKVRSKAHEIQGARVRMHFLSIFQSHQICSFSVCLHGFSLECVVLD